MFEIHLNDQSKGPVYAQIRDQIEAGIRDKELTPSEALPSPIVLAKQLAVDRGEVQRAYYELELSGLVTKKLGRDFLGKEKTTYLVK